MPAKPRISQLHGIMCAHNLSGQEPLAVLETREMSEESKVAVAFFKKCSAASAVAVRTPL